MSNHAAENIKMPLDVKNSQKYYDDSAKVLGNMIKQQLGRPFEQHPLNIWTIPNAAANHFDTSSGLSSSGRTMTSENGNENLDTSNFVPTTKGTMMELRCVVGVIRHGDRTPKQKMKMEVNNPEWFELFEQYNGFKSGKLKLKKPKQLQNVLDVARGLVMKTDLDLLHCQFDKMNKCHPYDDKV